MQIGVVKHISRYAVKSMAGENLEACSMDALGIPGDRGWAIRDETTGETTNGKHFPLLLQCAARYREPPAAAFIPHVDITFPDGAILGSDLPDINERLSKWLGRSSSLRHRVVRSSTRFRFTC